MLLQTRQFGTACPWVRLTPASKRNSSVSLRRSNCGPKCSVSQLELKSESESKAKRLTLNMALPCSASVPLTTLTSPLLFMFRYLIFSLYSVNYISINSRDLFLFVFVYQFEQFGLRTPQCTIQGTLTKPQDPKVTDLLLEFPILANQIRIIIIIQISSFLCTVYVASCFCVEEKVWRRS